MGHVFRNRHVCFVFIGLLFELPDVFRRSLVEMAGGTLKLTPAMAQMRWHTSNRMNGAGPGCPVRDDSALRMHGTRQKTTMFAKN